jgi:hypothetical protein
LNQIDDQNNDCDYEQQMDQSAADVAEKTKKPENDENYKYGPQHNFYFISVNCLARFCSLNACSPLNALQVLNFLSEFFLRSAESLLEPSQKFLILPFGKRKVIVGQLAVLLFQFAFHFIPTAFEL